MPNFPLYIPLIAAISAAFVASVLNSLATIWKGYRDDRRLLKKALYNSLELSMLLQASDIKCIMPGFALHLQDQLVLMGAPIEQAKGFTTTTPDDDAKLSDFFKSFQTKQMADVRERHSKAIYDVSEVDPLLAFRITNRLDINEWFNKVIALAGDEKGPTSHSLEVVEEVFHLMLHEYIDQINEDIRSLSRRISYLTWLKSYWLLRNVNDVMKSRYEKSSKMLADAFRTVASRVAESRLSAAPDK